MTGNIENATNEEHKLTMTTVTTPEIIEDTQDIHELTMATVTTPKPYTVCSSELDEAAVNIELYSTEDNQSASSAIYRGRSDRESVTDADSAVSTKGTALPPNSDVTTTTNDTITARNVADKVIHRHQAYMYAYKHTLFLIFLEAYQRDVKQSGIYILST